MTDKQVSYSQRIASQKAVTDSIKGKGKPLGGAPPIPKGKLSSLRLPKPSFDNEQPPDVKLPNQQNQVVEQQVQSTPRPPMTGVGAAYAVNQQQSKSRPGKGPMSLKEAREMAQEEKASPKSLSPQSVEAAAAIKKDIEAGNQAVVEQSQKTEKQVEEEGFKEVEEELAKTGLPFDFTAVADARQKLMNDERRKIIEGRLGPLDIADMITSNELRQEVPVIPGKLSVILRTYSQDEYLFCLQYLYGKDGSNFYIEELLNTCKLACSVVGVNGAVMQEHRVNVGKSDEAIDHEAFEKKLHQLSRFPVQFIGDLSVQAIWFNDRVSDLFNVENLKNG